MTCWIELFRHLEAVGLLANIFTHLRHLTGIQGAEDNRGLVKLIELIKGNPERLVVGSHLYSLDSVVELSQQIIDNCDALSDALERVRILLGVEKSLPTNVRKSKFLIQF